MVRVRYRGRAVSVDGSDARRVLARTDSLELDDLNTEWPLNVSGDGPELETLSPSERLELFGNVLGDSKYLDPPRDDSAHAQA